MKSFFPSPFFPSPFFPSPFFPSPFFPSPFFSSPFFPAFLLIVFLLLPGSVQAYGDIETRSVRWDNINVEQAAANISVSITGLDSVHVGDTLRAIVRITNPTDNDVTITGLSAIAYWVFRPWRIAHCKILGLSVGDSVPALDSVDATLEIVPDFDGRFSVDLQVASNAGPEIGTYDYFNSVSRTPHWAIELYSAGLSGCSRSTLHSMLIQNYRSSPAVVDSIGIRGEGWSLASTFSPMNLGADTLADVIFSRASVATDAAYFILFSHDATPDTLLVRVTDSFLRPRLLPEVDTIFVDVAPNEASSIALTVKNSGHGNFGIRQPQYLTTSAWNVEVDTTQSVLVSSPLQIVLHFIAQPEEGDYLWDITVPVVGCDTMMHKIIIARVRKPSGVSEEAVSTLSFWPQPAHSSLVLRSSGYCEFEILDMLGRPRLHGTVSGGLRHLDVSDLESGKYVLRSKDGDHVTSHIISVLK